MVYLYTHCLSINRNDKDFRSVCYNKGGKYIKIDILHFIDGAKKSQGINVIIDVLRAFSFKCYTIQKNDVLKARTYFQMSIIPALLVFVTTILLTPRTAAALEQPEAEKNNILNKDNASQSIPDASEEKEYYISWPFTTYESPSFTANASGRYDPQIVHLIESNEEGWGLILTDKGPCWTYLNEIVIYIEKETPIFNEIGDQKPICSISPRAAVAHRCPARTPIRRGLLPQHENLLHPNGQGNKQRYTINTIQNRMRRVAYGVEWCTQKKL